MNKTVLGIIKTVGITAAVTLLLLLSFTALSIKLPDPEAFLPIFSIVALILGAFLCGILAVRTIVGAPIPAALVASGLYLAMILILSLFFRNGEEYLITKIIVSIVSVIASATFGAFAAYPRGENVGKKRRNVMKRYYK